MRKVMVMVLAAMLVLGNGCSTFPGPGHSLEENALWLILMPPFLLIYCIVKASINGPARYSPPSSSNPAEVSPKSNEVPISVSPPPEGSALPNAGKVKGLPRSAIR